MTDEQSAVVSERHSYMGLYLGCGTDEFMISIFEVFPAEEKLVWRVTKRFGRRSAPMLAPDDPTHTLYTRARTTAYKTAIRKAKRLCLPYMPDLENNTPISEGEFLQILQVKNP